MASATLIVCSSTKKRFGNVFIQFQALQLCPNAQWRNWVLLESKVDWCHPPVFGYAVSPFHWRRVIPYTWVKLYSSFYYLNLKLNAAQTNSSTPRRRTRVRYWITSTDVSNTLGRPSVTSLTLYKILGSFMIGITIADSEISPLVHLIDISHSNFLSP